MNLFRSILIHLAIIFCFSGFAAAQDKKKIDPLPDSATLAESQVWLSKAFDKYFGYQTIDDSLKISELKFEGCKVSYRLFQRYTDQKSALGDRPALGNTGAVVAKDLTYSVYEDVAFDLKDIDSGQIALGPLPQPKSMQVILLQTLNKKDAIAFDRKGSTIRYNVSGVRQSTAFPIKEVAGEPIAKSWMHIIKLCQASK